MEASALAVAEPFDYDK
jgi:hypothetical protein